MWRDVIASQSLCWVRREQTANVAKEREKRAMMYKGTNQASNKAKKARTRANRGNEHYNRV
jgi:hypothetical protein